MSGPCPWEVMMMRLLPADGRPLQDDLAGGRDIQSTEHVEDRRLAGTVRSDECLDLPPSDLHVHSVHCSETAEVLGQPFDCEQHLVRSRTIFECGRKRGYPQLFRAEAACRNLPGRRRSRHSTRPAAAALTGRFFTRPAIPLGMKIMMSTIPAA